MGKRDRLERVLLSLRDDPYPTEQVVSVIAKKEPGTGARTIRVRRSTKRSVKAAGYVYFIVSGGLCKIGLSRTPLSRFESLSNDLDSPAHLIQAVRVANMHDAERRLHEKYGTYRHYNEWFALPESILIEIMTGLPSAC